MQSAEIEIPNSIKKRTDIPDVENVGSFMIVSILFFSCSADGNQGYIVILL